MPKKIPLSETREWLQSYEQGKPEASIAKDAHRDVKTIKSGIEHARRERYVHAAQVELLREALSKHQNQMLEVTSKILSALVVPDLDLRLRPPITIPGAKVNYEGLSGLVVVLNVENTPHWELLREHLKRDKMWKAVALWKKSLVAHLQARTALKLKTEMILEQKTKCTVVDKPINQPFLYSYTAGDRLYRALLNRALDIPNDENPEEHIVADTESGVVRWDVGTILAKAPGIEEECRENILDVFKNPRAVTEINQVADSYKEVKESIDKARRVVEEISLLGMVPGRCRVCHRLGI